MAETTRLTERLIKGFSKIFFSDYKKDLHEDMAQIYIELKNLTSLVYTMIAEYKSVVTIYKIGSDKPKEEEGR